MTSIIRPRVGLARLFGARRRLGWILGALCSSVLAGGACSDGGAHVANTIGAGDQTTNGRISVSEEGLRGTIAGGTLTVGVPITSLLDKSQSGSLRLVLRSVDGATTLGTATVDYQLAARATGTFTATLTAPSATTQSQLVDTSVRLDDGSTDGIRITRSMLRVIPPYDATLEGPARILQTRTASYRVRTEDVFTHRPVPDVDVDLTLTDSFNKALKFTSKTSVGGDAVFDVNLPNKGDYTAQVKAAAFGVAAVTDSPFSVELPGPKLLLTTDKPIYKPGQLVNLRALALSRDANKPLSAQALTFEIADAKGNKIFKHDVTTDSWGVASANFRIGSIVNEGAFKVRLLQGSIATEKTVTVGQYALPKFAVAVKTDRTWYQPGDSVTGTVDANYFFGKLVAGGDVVIEASSLDVGQTVFQRVTGKLDAQGHMGFTLTLPSTLAGIPLEQGKAAITLHVTVTDGAGQQVSKDAVVTVTPEAAQIVIVPESREIVPGIANTLLLFVTDPTGAAIANASVAVTAPNGQTLTTTTDAYGEAALVWTPPKTNTQGAFQAVVTLPDGSKASKSVTFTNQSGTEHLVVRTDQAVYQTGDTIQVAIDSTEATGSVYVDWLNDGQAVDMRTLDVKDGKASFTMPVDTSLTGSNRIEAYIVDSDGNIVRAARTVFARNATALNIALSTDKSTYAPGEPAKLTFSVTDETGKPAVAALGVQIVDQAVFGLIDAQPALLRTFFELEDQFATPNYEIEGPNANLPDLLFNETNSRDANAEKAAQVRAAATLAALSNTSLTGIDTRTWPKVIADVVQRLTPVMDAQKALIAPTLRQIAQAALTTLIAEGCSASTDYCPTRNASLNVVLGQTLQNSVKIFDLWGNAYSIASDYSGLRLVTKGPDEVDSTGDDKTLTFSYGDLGLTAGDQKYVAGGGPLNSASGGAAAIEFPAATGGVTAAGGATSGGGAGGDTGQPRVRRDFPETLYVNPDVITGSDGKATVSLNMADSITEWRVSSLANSADGRLGGAESGVTVFQDFFVDVNFPATLTRGDEVSFPIAVYNYLDVPQTVQLSLQPGTWYTPLGTTTQSVDLAAGQVLGVDFPVRVDNVGIQTLTVTATGSSKSDAVARTVRVVPDGKQFPTALSGLLSQGSAAHSVNFAADAVPGSDQLYLEVYPAFLSQVVKGMDSMLQVPNGCFEQTTSTTWPNVLVTAYMKATNQITPDIQMKADSLISAGYQRLLTFEHPGGGFSWFGTQDPAPFLSVTAFGVMEFSDMRQVATVDDAMFQRTVNWLVSQQKGDGSWPGDTSEFFTFNTSTLRNTAFVLSALTAAGYTGPGVTNGVSYLKSNLNVATEDSYTLGLVASALVEAAPADSMTTNVLARLDSAKQVNGEEITWDSGNTQTNFYGAGGDAKITTTAMVAHALLESGSYKSDVDGAIKFLAASKDSLGNFGSTQATVWTLRTLLLAATKGTDGAVGSFSVTVDGVPFGTVNLTANQSDVMTTVDLSTRATTGSHAVQLDFVGTGKVSYNLVSSYYRPWSVVPVDPIGPLSIDLTYDKTQLYVDDVVTATANVVNNTTSTENMILVTLGIPPGFAILGEDLEAYLSTGVLSRWETTGKQLILYVRQLGPSASQSFQYRLRATMPIKATDGGAEVKPYYEPTLTAMKPAQQLEALKP